MIRSAFVHIFGRVDFDHSDSSGIVRRGTLSTASVAIQGILRFVYSVLIGRLLGPVLLATTNSAISLAQFVSLLWPTASGSAAIKFLAQARAREDDRLTKATAVYLSRSILWLSLVLSMLAGTFSYLASADHDPVKAALVVCLTFAFSSYTFVRGIYFALGLIARAVTWDLISTVVGIGLLMVVIFSGWSALLLAPLTLSYAVYALVGWPRIGGGAAKLPGSLRREITTFILWTSLGSLAASGFLQLSMVIAHAVGTGEESGLYASALSLATPASLLGSALTLVLFPLMARSTAHNDLTLLRRQADGSTRALMATLGGAFGVLALLSRELIGIIYGSVYIDADWLLIILLAASLVTVIRVGAVNVLLSGSHRLVRVPALLASLGMMVGLGTMAALSPSLSVTGVGLGYLIGAVVASLGPILVVWKHYSMAWAAIWIRFLCGAAVAGMLLVAENLLPWNTLADVIACVIFLALWILLMRPEIRMMVSLRKRTTP